MGKLATVFLIVFLTALISVPNRVQCKAIFGIGMRIIGDQLLLKDVLLARAAGLAQRPQTEFNYILTEPITYVEIVSEENVHAKVHFSYQNELVQGTVAAINATTALPFEVLITIYGFNETMLNVHPSYILNKDQHFEGILEPQQNDDELDDATDELLTNSEEYSERNDNDNTINEDEEMEEDFEHGDKVIEVGERQQGDYLIYETYQTSLTSTEKPENHTVIFYYIDSDFITYVRFVVFDHFNNKTTGSDYRPPLAEYTHFSPTTLKATITEQNATNLFVQMFLYGYRPMDLPAVGYVPFLRPTRLQGHAASAVGEASMSPLQRLKKLMNAQQRPATTDETTTDETQTAGAIDNSDALVVADNALVAVHTNDGAASMSADLLTRTGVATLISFLCTHVARRQIYF